MPASGVGAAGPFADRSSGPGPEQAGPGGAGEHSRLHDQLTFLNAATARIGVSLDITSVVREFALALVPRLAEFVSVHVLDSLCGEHQPETRLPDAHAEAAAPLRRVAVACADDSSQWLAVAPEGAAQVMRPDGPCRRAMTTGEPIVIERVDDALARQLAEEHPTGDLFPIMVGRAMLVVPLRVRGRVLGCATLISGRDGSFDDISVLTAAQLAAQASLGVDNARLYQGQAATAMALGRSMLPSSPPTLAGVQIAHRYLPGNPAAQVGGDWYDAIALPGSRVALVVGDVMGHGIGPASVMGHLRTAVQTLAALDLPPEQVLRHLDDLAQRLGEDHLATCLYAVYDPVARRCTIANAGHIPPVLVRRNGRGQLLDVPCGAPIGVGAVAFETVEIQTEEDDLLVLCTDGLVEMRGQDIGTGLAALCEKAAAPGRQLEELCESILAELGATQREDDVALLVARLSGIPSRNIAQWYLEPTASTAYQARRLIGETLASWGLEESTDLAQLLVTELVSNAIRYASRPLELRLLLTDVLLCELNDDDHHLPVLRRADLGQEHGRGLQLVSHLAQRWGSSRTHHGKVVWFELPIAEPEMNAAA